MSESFIALSNMTGLVCASDTDHVVYPLLEAEPVAVAVDFNSPIPWKDIVNEYKEMYNEPQEQFSGYVDNLYSCLYNMDMPESLTEVPEDTKIIIMGYGTDELFPTICELRFELLGPKYLQISDKKYNMVSSEERSQIAKMGDFSAVDTLLDGVTMEVLYDIIEKEKEAFGLFCERVRSRFQNTEYEAVLESQLEKFDIEKKLTEYATNAVKEIHNHVNAGIHNFAIPDMVQAAETLLNANANFRSLHDKGEKSADVVRELAVLTCTEGLTWIKHSIATE